MARKRDTDERVQRWVAEHPTGSQQECWAELETEGYSKSTVYDKFKSAKKLAAAISDNTTPGTTANTTASTAEKHPGRPKTSNKTEKLTVALTPKQKIKLKTYASSRGLTPSDVLGELIESLTISLDDIDK